MTTGSTTTSPGATTISGKRGSPREERGERRRAEQRRHKRRKINSKVMPGEVGHLSASETLSGAAGNETRSDSVAMN